tara:strand:- start:263 stop:766 length:504 start_codon:yes stop_codon:yes gene_type:complete
LNITRLIEKILIRLFLIATFVPLQSCSNTLIGEKLENSFDITANPTISGNNTKVKVTKQLSEIKKIKSSKKDNEEENKIVQGNIIKNNLISNNDRLSQKSTKSTKSTKRVIFTPQPYRIILKLSGANPSAPAETVTNALRKAGVEFEVEKIERFDEKSLLKDSSLKR